MKISIYNWDVDAINNIGYKLVERRIIPQDFHLKNYKLFIYLLIENNTELKRDIKEITEMMRASLFVKTIPDYSSGSVPDIFICIFLRNRNAFNKFVDLIESKYIFVPKYGKEKLMSLAYIVKQANIDF